MISHTQQARKGPRARPSYPSLPSGLKTLPCPLSGVAKPTQPWWTEPGKGSVWVWAETHTGGPAPRDLYEQARRS